MFTSSSNTVLNLNTFSDLNKLYGNAFAKSIYKCKSKKCQMKNVFCAQYKVIGTAS